MSTTTNASVSIVMNEEGIEAKVDGKGKDLINMFANVMSEDKQFREVIEMSLMALIMKEEMGDDEEENENSLAEFYSTNKPTAEA
jgi:hypothetical protein